MVLTFASEIMDCSGLLPVNPIGIIVSAAEVGFRSA